jgi:23S rRNA (guanosine2251-2'-O)-methyltransferase
MTAFFLFVLLQGMKQQNIIGRNPVVEALQAGKAFEKILIGKTATGDVIKQIIGLAREKDIFCQFVPDVKLDSISRANHQGVIGIMSLVPYYDLQDIVNAAYDQGEDPLVVVLDSITDVRNFGAIARSALGLGAHGIIIPRKGSVSIQEDAIKVSAGALLKIPVCRADNLAAALKDLKNNGLKVIGLDGQAKEYVQQNDLKMPLAIVLGSEGEGITAPVKKLLDRLVKLPMNPDLESYNVSVAAAIALYEVKRQRG